MSRKMFKYGAYAFAILWGITTLFPLAITLLSSFKDNNGIYLSMFSLPKEWIWQNYTDAFTVAKIGRGILNSIFIAIISTALTIVIGMFTAYILSRKKFKYKSLIYLLFVVGVMIPVHCTIIPISSLSTILNGKNTYWFIILVYVAFGLSQAVFLFTGYLDGIDKEIDEAAIIDGCNDFQLLFRILYPVSIPIISTEAILAFIAGYGELIFSMILFTDESKYTVARSMLAFSGGYQQRLGPIFACIIIAVLPMLVLYIFFHEKVQAGMMAGSIKG